MKKLLLILLCLPLLFSCGENEKLLKEIEKRAKQNNRIIDCLLQVHIAQESGKFGFGINEIQQTITVLSLIVICLNLNSQLWFREKLNNLFQSYIYTKLQLLTTSYIYQQKSFQYFEFPAESFKNIQKHAFQGIVSINIQASK